MSEAEKETERLKKLVLDICDGRVFVSWGLRHEELRSVFMVLALAGPEHIPADATMVWAPMSEAGPMSINGLPCFVSCHFESRETHERILKAVHAELDRRKEVTV